MTTPNPAVPGSIDELSEEWLTTALGSALPSSAVTGFDVAPVGTGQMADSYRLELSYQGPPGPESVVVKVPAEHELSRAAGGQGAYANEVNFYAELAPTVDICAPSCHYAALTDDQAGFVLVLEDLRPAEQGDQIAGCDVTRAAAAVDNLAGLHGPRWCDPALADHEWLARADAEGVGFAAELMKSLTPAFLERYADRLEPAHAEVIAEFGGRTEPWLLARPERFGLVHGDYRLDNLLFATPAGGYACSTVDWQTVAIGLPARDLAYFLGNGLHPVERADHERDLVGRYHSRLVSYGVGDYRFETCWDDYRFGQFQGPFITVLGSMHVEQTARGDDMFMAMASRSCQAILDLGSDEFLR